MILYHTQEMTERWQSDPRLPEQKIPRSVVGKGGGVMPAIGLVPQELLGKPQTYVEYGTVYGADLMTIFAVYDGTRKDDVRHIRSLDCNLGFEFYLIPDSKGTYEANGERFDIWFNCES
jgi:hypothetical protein